MYFTIEDCVRQMKSFRDILSSNEESNEFPDLNNILEDEDITEEVKKNAIEHLEGLISR